MAEIDQIEAEIRRRLIRDISGGGDGQKIVIATTPDGGKVYEMPDGSRSFAGPSYSTNDPAQVEKIMAGATPAETYRSGVNESIIADHPIASRVASTLQGVPFVGEWTDEAAGLMYGDKAAAGVRGLQGAMEENRPGQSTALKIGGAIAGGLPLVGPAVGAIRAAPTLMGQATRGMIGGAVGGAVEGAAAGAGADEENRMRGATRGGMFGATAGAVVGALTPVFGDAAREVWQRVKKTDVATIADELGVDRQTALVIKRHLMNDNLDEASARLASMGDDAMLADAGVGTMQALDTVTQTGGKALKVGKEAVEGRANTMATKFRDRLDEIFGTAGGRNAGARAISERTADARRKAYDLAFSKPIDYASEAGRKIEGVFSRIPSGTLRKAISEANDEMKSLGLENMQILAEIADDGTVSFTEMPNVRQLDALKKALSQIVEQEKDEFGRIASGEGLRAMRLASELRDALGAAVPAYKRATRLGGDKIAEDGAYRMGLELLKPGTTLEDVRALFKNPSMEMRNAAVQGFRENLEEIMTNTRRTITDPNRDARAAMQVIKELSSEASRKKMLTVFGPERTRRLLAEIDKMTGALELRAVLATNSKTAVRQAGQEALKEATQPGMMGRLARGELGEAARAAVKDLTGATDEAAVARAENIAGQIAEALTTMRGDEARQALRIVQAAMEGQPVRDAELDFLAEVVGAPAFLAAYQSGKQALEQLQGGPR